MLQWVRSLCTLPDLRHQRVSLFAENTVVTPRQCSRKIYMHTLDNTFIGRVNDRVSVAVAKVPVPCFKVRDVEGQKCCGAIWEQKRDCRLSMLNVR